MTLATCSSAFCLDSLASHPSLIYGDVTGSDDSVDENAASVDEWRGEERRLRKKLKQILKLEEEFANGKQQNSEQMRKVESHGSVKQQLQLDFF